MNTTIWYCTLYKICYYFLRTIKRSKKNFIRCRSILDTLQLYACFLCHILDKRLLVLQIDFHFIWQHIQTNYTIYERNTSWYKVLSPILAIGTRFYYFMTLEIWRFWLRPNVTFMNQLENLNQLLSIQKYNGLHCIFESIIVWISCRRKKSSWFPLSIRWKNESHRNTSAVIDSFALLTLLSYVSNCISFFHRILTRNQEEFFRRKSTSWNSYQSIQFFKLIHNITFGFKVIPISKKSQFSSKKFEIEINVWEDRLFGFFIGPPLFFWRSFFCHRVLKNAIFFWKKKVLKFSQETLGKYKYSMEIIFSNIDNHK